MVDEHAEPVPPARAELADLARQVVDAVERLDDDALDPQVVAPHPLDELRVVLALDPDPAAAGDPRALPADRDRAGRGGAQPGGRRGDRAGHGTTGRPSTRKPGPSGKTRTLPCRSSSETRSLSHSTTAPHQPVVGSSTTSPASAATLGRGGGGRREAATTSTSYSRLRTRRP